MHVFVIVHSFFKGHLAEIIKLKKGNDEYPALELFHEWYVHLSVPVILLHFYIHIKIARRFRHFAYCIQWTLRDRDTV